MTTAQRLGVFGFLHLAYFGTVAGDPQLPTWLVGVVGVVLGIATASAIAFANQRARDVVDAAAKTPDTSDDAPAAAEAEAWKQLALALQRGDIMGAAQNALFVWPKHPSVGPPPVVLPSSPAAVSMGPKG